MAVEGLASGLRLRLPWVAIASALPLVVFAVVMIVIVNGQQQRSIEVMLRQATSASVQVVDERMLAFLGALDMLATSRVLEDGSEPAIADRMRRALRARPDWSALEVHDRDGHARTYLPDGSSDPAVSGYPAIAGQVEAVFRDGKPRIGGILVDSEQRREPLVAVSVPVPGDAGVARVLTAYVRALSIHRALRERSLAPGWLIAIIDGDHRLVARTLSTDPMDPHIGRQPDPSVLEGLQRGQTYFFARTLQGARVYTATAPSPFTGWTILLGAPASEVEQTKQLTVLALVGGGAAALLLALAFGGFLVHSYARREEAERRLLALEAASAAERRSAAILESTTDGVYELDRNWRITFINRRARHLIASGKDLTGRIVWEAFPDLVNTVFWHRYHRSMAEQTPAEFEEFYPTLDRWYAVRTFPSPDGLAVYFQDVTERKAMENALRNAKDEAEQANLAKSKFLAAASHDLRQPMQSLFLFSAALAPHIASERGRSTLALLDRGLDTLKALLDSLLDVSRLDAGVIQPEVVDVPLDAIVEDIEAAFAPVAAAKGLDLQVEHACAFAVRTDPTLLGRMIRNLVENAIRYTQRGGIRIACQPAGGMVRIAVSDTGIGIPPEHLERIFEEFHQVGNPERDRSQGLGLGLAIVRRLSRLLGHPVRVDSQVGQGSTFSIDVPVGARDAEASTMPCAPAPVAMHGLLALVIDDDAMVLTGLRTVLEGWSYEVAMAGSGDEALERLRELGRAPDIVIADYRLRDGEVGTEVVRRVRAFLGHAVPGIILTGETGPEHQQQAALHDLGLAHKPVTPRQLFNALERQLRAAE